MATRIQLRRDISANWVSNNPILAEGEIGIETDTNKLKIGNGISTWNILNYYGSTLTLHSELTLDDGTNPHGTTKSDLGLSNVDNTSDLNKPISTATQNALNTKLDKDTTAGVERVWAFGTDGIGFEKPTSDFKDVLEFSDLASFPATGETGKIYVALDTNFTYRWSGSVYVQIGNQFKKKSENLGYDDPTLSGSNAVIQLRPEGNSYYAFSNSGLVSIDGFGLSLITGNPNVDAPYPGKDLWIKNTGATSFNLLHDGTGTADAKFFFQDGNDLTVPPQGVVLLKYFTPYCEVIFKSWSDGGKRTQLIHDCSGWQLNTALNFVTVSAASGASWNLTNNLKSTTPGNTTNAVNLIQNTETVPLAVVAYTSKLKKLTLESRFSYYRPNDRFLIGYFTKKDSIFHLTPTVLFDELIEYGNEADGLYQQIEINSDIEIPAGALLVYAIASNDNVSSTTIQRFYALHTLIELEEI